jgi:hypothetical protein
MALREVATTLALSRAGPMTPQMKTKRVPGQRVEGRENPVFQRRGHKWLRVASRAAEK